jgi:hypothetical protein
MSKKLLNPKKISVPPNLDVDATETVFISAEERPALKQLNF